MTNSYLNNLKFEQHVWKQFKILYLMFYDFFFSGKEILFIGKEKTFEH